MNVSREKLKYIALVLSAFSLLACVPTRIVRPLAKGEKQISAHLGGPLIGFAGTTIPIPFTSLNYAQGIHSRVTAYGGMAPTALMYGVFQLDLGTCIGLSPNDSSRWGMSVNPEIHLMKDFFKGPAKLYPQFDFNVYYSFQPGKSFVYAGCMNWFDLSMRKGHQQAQTTHWNPAPQIGFTWVRSKWNFNWEYKWISPGKVNIPNVVDFKGINHKGVQALYFTISRKF